MYGDKSGEFVCESWGLVEARQRIKFLVRITYNIIINIAFQMGNMVYTLLISLGAILNFQ